jgi:hypothetical protein
MEDRVSAGLSAAELRKFGLTVGGAFAAFALIAWWRGHPISTRVLGGLGGALIVGGAVLPTLLGPVYSAWMGLAKVLSSITTPIFLGIVYFVIFTPVGIVRRLLGKDALDRDLVKNSYFVARSAKANPSMERLY